jgi:predicted NBD/HSP70 family sugar kinase
MSTSVLFGLVVGLYVGGFFLKAAIVDLRARVAKIERELHPEPERNPDEDSLYE